jgi:hypothetical protein
MGSRSTGRNVPMNSFYELCQAFVQSEKFATFTEGTQTLWAREFKFLMSPNCLGHVTLKDIRPALVQGYLDGWTDKPGKQATALSALRALNKWARKRDLLPTSIIEGIEVERGKGGRIPWTDAQVALAVAHARPDLARTVMLGAWTGQRISDLVRMCPTDISTLRGISGINVLRRKPDARFGSRSSKSSPTLSRHGVGSRDRSFGASTGAHGGRCFSPITGTKNGAGILNSLSTEILSWFCTGCDRTVAFALAARVSPTTKSPTSWACRSRWSVGTRAYRPSRKMHSPRSSNWASTDRKQR